MRLRILPISLLFFRQIVSAFPVAPVTGDNDVVSDQPVEANPDTEDLELCIAHEAEANASGRCPFGYMDA
ncbi:hypothetical protein SAMD00023353_4800730 [Rosellinia necatrix]|uniref:Uncharacterized protein n=1 Tax=Rosellinia necatrix TaxID=77044 RepID=A0A1W2TQ98_ROSNE|nr:hypothetical protein SAMD00023353_4800730 [Rosellinia necatrix]